MKQQRSRGAALLTAMLTVALVATFAAAALWQQWRSIEVEAAERARVQSAWILTGALDWSRLILREDAHTRVDHLGEPWAVPLQEARLSSFLAADRNNAATDSGPEVLEAFLSGQIIDLQSLLNVNNLLEANGKLSESGLESFRTPVRGARAAAGGARIAGGEPALCLGHQHRQPLAPWPHCVRNGWNSWHGWACPRKRWRLSNPISPCCLRRTAVNLNTASAEVIYASGRQLSHGRRAAAGRRARARPLQDQQRRLQAAAERRARPGPGAAGGGCRVQILRGSRPAQAGTSWSWRSGP